MDRWKREGGKRTFEKMGKLFLDVDVDVPALKYPPTHTKTARGWPQPSSKTVPNETFETFENRTSGICSKIPHTRDSVVLPAVGRADVYIRVQAPRAAAAARRHEPGTGRAPVGHRSGIGQGPGLEGVRACFGWPLPLSRSLAGGSSPSSAACCCAGRRVLPALRVVVTRPIAARCCARYLSALPRVAWCVVRGACCVLRAA